MLDTQKALKQPKTKEYYDNYDRIFGGRNKAGGDKNVPDLETDEPQGDMDKPKSEPEARPD